MTLMTKMKPETTISKRMVHLEGNDSDCLMEEMIDKSHCQGAEGVDSIVFGKKK